MDAKRILNLGAGVQSTALYLMALDGEIEAFDVAIFADVQEEPGDVYKHIDWLDSLGGPPILRVTAGRLGDALDRGTDSRGNARSDGGHYVAIPSFLKHPDGGTGRTQRQCTRDFKIAPLEKAIRQKVFNCEPGRPIPKTSTVIQAMGLSYDEPKRVIRVKQRFLAKPKNWQVEFPLFDLEMTRGDCQKYLAKRVPHEVPRSACVFCPFKSDAEWRRLRETDQQGWARAVEIDKVCRKGTGLDSQRFLHRSCLPLAEVDLRPQDEKTGQRHLFSGWQDECEGYCGN
jgi:hypothetical protein